MITSFPHSPYSYGIFKMYLDSRAYLNRISHSFYGVKAIQTRIANKIKEAECGPSKGKNVLKLKD